MPYFHNDKVNTLFIHIPKTGGTHVQSVYARKYNIPINTKSLYMFDTSFSKVSLQHQTLTTLLANKKRFKIVDDALELVTVVRNPYTRFISQLYWVNKITNKTTPEQAEKIAQNYVKKYAKDPHCDDNHLLPQNTFLVDKDGVIDPSIKILKQETLDSDLKAIGIDPDSVKHIKYIHPGSKNPPSHPMKRVLHVKPAAKPVVKKEGKIDNYYKQMTMKLVEMINTMYKEDFEKFNYDMITTEEQLRQRL